MSFSFKPTPETETGGGSQAHEDGVVAPTPQTGSSLSYASRFAGEGKSIAQMVLFGIFGISLITAAVLFWYQSYLTSQIASKKVSLEEEEAKLGALPLDAMRKLSNRIKAADKLIKGHASARVAFRIIEDSIEDPVTYKNFDLHVGEGANSYVLNLSARAESYHAVIQQAETLKSKAYANFVPKITVEDVRLDDMGGVTFNIKMPVVITGLLPEGVVFGSDDTNQLVVASSSAIVPISGTTTVSGSSSPAIAAEPKNP